MAGKTTLLTTVLICVEAVCQVLSTAPATSPVPAANAVVAIMQAMSSDRMKQAISLLVLRFIKIPPFFFRKKGREPHRKAKPGCMFTALLRITLVSRDYFEGAICHSSHRSPEMRTESVRFMESIPAGVQQSRSQEYGV